MEMKALWICHAEDNRETRLVPVFRRCFTVGAGLKKADLKMTSHGIYEAEMNGMPVTEDRFMPGLTSYYYRIQVQEYDVTGLLHEGENVWKTTVGDGWWRWNNNFGYTLALLGELTLLYEDGRREVIGTDESFEVGTGPVVRSDLQKGEVYDARLEDGEACNVHPENGLAVAGARAGAGGRTDDGSCADGFSHAVLCTEHTEGELIPQQGVPVREKEHFAGKPVRDSAGRLVIDFGQNIAGYVQMTLHHTKPGQVIHLVHGEGFDPEGRFSTANCDGGRREFQEVTYICRGAENEVYKPHFAVFGFRYVLVEGLDDEETAGAADDSATVSAACAGDCGAADVSVAAGAAGAVDCGAADGSVAAGAAGSEAAIGAEFEAIAVYSDMEETGDFSCSNPLLNQLVRNARWSQKGNFLDVPVDCPTRERNAWTGDAMIYCRTAAYFMNVSSFFKKWLRDQTIEQYASGKVGITFPSTSSVHNKEELVRVQAENPAMALAGPEGDGNIGEDSTGWGDSAVWIPWQMYLMYGDEEFLGSQYETAKRWTDFSLGCMKEVNPRYADCDWYKNGDGDLIYDTRFHYGEWNEPLPPSPEVIELFAKGGTAADYVRHMAGYGQREVATAYTKRSCEVLAEMAKVLGKAEDAAFYADRAGKIKTAYDRYLIGEDGTILKGHQAPYIRALALGMVSEEKKPLVIARLKEELEAADYHLNTGFLSTVYLLPTLCDNGMVEEAYRILEQTSAPGWLHPILLGATTMLENWNGMDVFRDSFNHYSFGAVCQFLFEYTAGIRPDERRPGFKEFVLKPLMGGTLTWAEGSYKTPYGVIRSRWERDGSSWKYTCEVPEGGTAYLTLPDGREETLSGGRYEFRA